MKSRSPQEPELLLHRDLVSVHSNDISWYINVNISTIV